MKNLRRTSEDREYVATYRRMMEIPGTLPWIIEDIIRRAGKMERRTLAHCVERLGYATGRSGSWAASLIVLEVDGLIRRDGRGDTQNIVWLGERDCVDGETVRPAPKE